MSYYYITTPIYYVNSNPHLGHAYTTILADCLTRFNYFMGNESFMITGTDEHGDKISQAAEKKGVSPKEFVDEISQKFRDLWGKLDIKYNRFIRTTDPDHMACVQKILQQIYDKGDIYFGEYGGFYCYGCERFYTEKELEDGLCPQHKVKPEYISEKNYFFRMPKYTEWLKQYIEDNPEFIRPEKYRTEVLSLLESGALEDLCISRPKSRLTWGIELPFDRDYVCYVWFDALINYISGIGWPDGKNFKKFWPGEHLVAKDILKPHAVFWPTMLKAAGIEPYKHLNVHGYWLVKETKMSKSLGNVVAPLKIARVCGLDSFRYYLLREMHFGNDASFSFESLLTRHNADLSNDLGNLFSRVLSMLKKYCDSVAPQPGTLTPEDEEICQSGIEAQKKYLQLFEQAKFSYALESLWELIRALNKYVDTSTPWVLYKNNDTERLGTVMYILLTGMYKVAVQLLPVMPHTARTMLEQLGVSRNPELFNLAKEAETFEGIIPGQKMAAASNLFPRLEEDAFIQKSSAEEAKPAIKEKSGSNDKKQAPEGVLIEFGDFSKIDLRIGTIITAEKHPDADKLLRLEVDLGEDTPRQIVAGIAEFFTPDQLIGRQVCAVANLAPRKLRGLESQGMLLAIRKTGGMELLGPSGAVPNGSKIS